MATKIFHIELTVQGVDSPERMDALVEAVREAGRNLNASVLLICGEGPPPQIDLTAEDFVDGRTVIAT